MRVEEGARGLCGRRRRRIPMGSKHSPDGALTAESAAEGAATSSAADGAAAAAVPVRPKLDCGMCAGAPGSRGWAEVPSRGA